MRVLIVCSKNSGKIAPFIVEQVEALNRLGVTTDYFTIEQKGVSGYLKSRKPLLDKIAGFRPDIIHAHFGLSGLLANLQRRVPVVTTYHGCDINRLKLRIISYFPLLMSKYNIFVSQPQADKVKLFRRRYDVIPCGIDYTNFYPLDKQQQRKELGWADDKRIILFSSDFQRPEKNAALAQKAIAMLDNYELIELKGYSKSEMLRIMNACDVGLLTSLREGSPMFIKEMMACSRPLVSTDVGDVREQIGGVEGCKIVNFDVLDVKEALEYAVKYANVEYPIFRLEYNNNEAIARKINQIYYSIKK